MFTVTKQRIIVKRPSGMPLGSDDSDMNAKPYSGRHFTAVSSRNENRFDQCICVNLQQGTVFVEEGERWFK